MFLGFPSGSDGKESACSVGDLGSTPGLGRSPGEGNGNTLQYSGLENSKRGCEESDTNRKLSKHRNTLTTSLVESRHTAAQRDEPEEGRTDTPAAPRPAGGTERCRTDTGHWEDRQRCCLVAQSCPALWDPCKLTWAAACQASLPLTIP